jgi:hypothetical protein
MKDDALIAAGTRQAAYGDAPATFAQIIAIEAVG